MKLYICVAKQSRLSTKNVGRLTFYTSARVAERRGTGPLRVVEVDPAFLPKGEVGSTRVDGRNASYYSYSLGGNMLKYVKRTVKEVRVNQHGSYCN